MTTIAKIAKRDNEQLKAIAKEKGDLSRENSLLEYRGSNAVINVTGPIFRYANMFTEISGATSTDAIAKAIGEAEQSDVDAIVFNFDSPGGEATEISNLAELIATTPKPTVAYVGAMAASAGYWLASAADEIVIGSTGLVGSIGTVATIDLSSDDETIEIVSSQSPNKRLDASTEEGQQSIQAMVDKMAQVFIENVAMYRKVSVEHVLTYFGKGGLLMGAEAVAAGMADRIGSFETLVTTGEVKMQDENMFKLEDLNAEFLQANCESLYDSILAEGIAAGAEGERMRIQGIHAHSMPGFEASIEAMMFDGQTKPEQAAVKLLGEIKAQGDNVMNLVAETQSPIVDEPVDSRCDLQKQWDANADGCRQGPKKFSNFENFRAYQEGVKSGVIKHVTR